MTNLLEKLLPSPQSCEAKAGALRLSPRPEVSFDAKVPELSEPAKLLAESCGFPRSSSSSSSVRTDGIWLTLEPDVELGPEGYQLTIEEQGGKLSAPTIDGILHGVQTMIQLAPEYPACFIRDWPAFPWRGLLLDCCRHFMTPDFVKKMLGVLARYKMNRFHWHLTEDQGWRLEIPRDPKLTEIGAWRGQGKTRHGGFYTQNDVRDIVAHAKLLGLTVVPEIEMPGHAKAALAAHPELSCRGQPIEVETEWGIFEDVYCAGREETFEFLERVMADVLALFPGEFVHIGGDECPKTRWKDCSRCQQRIREEGLRDEDQLQSYFVSRMGKFLANHGRRMIGWDEILEGGLAPGATVQSWQGMEGAIAAAQAGHDAIVSPTSHAYFDYGLDKIDLRQAFSFDPVPPSLSNSERKHILGGECNMWTERAPQAQVEAKILPRMLAFAERLWKGTTGNFEEFRNRVAFHRERLHDLGIECGPDGEEC